MRTVRVTLLAGLILMLALPAMAQSAREVHRPSEIGGTGMMLMRAGDQLNTGEMNASIFLNYMAFSKLPLNYQRIPFEPFVEDPRGDAELWMSLNYNYGVNNLLELGLQIPVVFISDLRDAGVGRIGADVRLLILNSNKIGLGISSTLWANYASIQKDISSSEINGGFELNFSFRGEFATNYLGSAWFDKYLLEPMRAYATMGWGYEDYLLFNKLEPKIYPATPLNRRNPNDPELVGEEVLYGGLGLEYEIYDQLFIGAEGLVRQYPDRKNDNNFFVIVPEISYTYKDIITGMVAFGFKPEVYDYKDQPDWLVTAGLSYHFPGLVKHVQPEGAPPAAEDLIDVFSPSRKPIPSEMQEQEIPIAPNGEGEETEPEPE